MQTGMHLREEHPSPPTPRGRFVYHGLFGVREQERKRARRADREREREPTEVFHFELRANHAPLSTAVLDAGCGTETAPPWTPLVQMKDFRWSTVSRRASGWSLKRKYVPQYELSLQQPRGLDGPSLCVL